MAKLDRPVNGPGGIAALVSRIARPAFAKSSPGTAQMVEAWPSIVGPALAVVTTPRRLTQGTLTITCSGPVAMELQHLSNELLGRINQYLGRQSVHRLRFLQTQTQAPRGTLKPRPAPSKAAAAATEAAIADLPDGPLKDALALLGRAVLTESTSRLGKQPNTRS